MFKLKIRYKVLKENKVLYYHNDDMEDCKTYYIDEDEIIQWY